MKKGTLIAGAVAGMFAMGAFAADPAPAAKDTKEAAKVKCVGLNECKGKGVTPTTEADCKAKKGTVVAEAAKPAEKAPAKK